MGPWPVTGSVRRLHPSDSRKSKAESNRSSNQSVDDRLLVHNGRRRRQVNGVCDSRGLARAILLAAAMLVLFMADFAEGAEPAPTELRANTLAAFDRYVKLTQARNEEELKRGTNLLWIDELPQPEGAEAHAALERGEVKMKKLVMLDGGKPIVCPGGIIHHWVGLVFIPGAKLEDVLAMLEDYDRHSVYYAPDVERSKIESRNDDHFRVFLRFRRHKVITVVLDTEHEIDYFHDGPGRAHSRSSAVRIAEVANPGKNDEHEKPPGQDGGFLWRMETWWRMEEQGGGVYVQSEVVSLTRDIPVVLKWMIEPFVTSIPRETLTATLVATRKAVESRMAKPGSAAGTQVSSCQTQFAPHNVAALRDGACFAEGDFTVAALTAKAAVLETTSRSRGMNFSAFRISPATSSGRSACKRAMAYGANGKLLEIVLERRDRLELFLLAVFSC